MLPDIGEWKTVREADQAGGPVRLRRDHDRISLDATIGAFFGAPQLARFSAAAEEILAEIRVWVRERCECGIFGGPATVIPPACPVHGVACPSCGGLEGCADGCGQDGGRPRDESDCRCGGMGGECPCEADGGDGLCSCCRNGDCNGSCAAPGQAIASMAPLPDHCAYHGGEGSGHPGCPGCQEDEAATAAGRKQ